MDFGMVWHSVVGTWHFQDEQHDEDDTDAVDEYYYDHHYLMVHTAIDDVLDYCGWVLDSGRTKNCCWEGFYYYSCSQHVVPRTLLPLAITMMMTKDSSMLMIEKMDHNALSGEYARHTHHVQQYKDLPSDTITFPTPLDFLLPWVPVR